MKVKFNIEDSLCDQIYTSDFDFILSKKGLDQTIENYIKYWIVYRFNPYVAHLTYPFFEIQ